MSEDQDFPEEVLAAIRADRKIDAIKLLRKHSGLGLKEAKEVVDAYVSEHPTPRAQSGAKTDTGIGRLVLVGLIAAAAYIAYRFLV